MPGYGRRECRGLPAAPDEPAAVAAYGPANCRSPSPARHGLRLPGNVRLRRWDNGQLRARNFGHRRPRNRLTASHHPGRAALRRHARPLPARLPHHNWDPADHPLMISRAKHQLPEESARALGRVVRLAGVPGPPRPRPRRRRRRPARFHQGRRPRHLPRLVARPLAVGAVADGHHRQLEGSQHVPIP